MRALLSSSQAYGSLQEMLVLGPLLPRVVNCLGIVAKTGQLWLTWLSSGTRANGESQNLHNEYVFGYLHREPNRRGWLPATVCFNIAQLPRCGLNTALAQSALPFWVLKAQTCTIVSGKGHPQKGYTCIVTTTRELACFGNNSDGQCRGLRPMGIAVSNGLRACVGDRGWPAGLAAC